MLTELTKIVIEFWKQFSELLNNSETNENIEKYNNLIYQRAETESAEPVLKEIELIIKKLKSFKASEKNEIN